MHPDPLSQRCRSTADFGLRPLLAPSRGLTRPFAKYFAITLAGLLFGGCAKFFTESESELGIIPLNPSTNVVIHAVLPQDARLIRFASDSPLRSGQGDDRVTVTFTNNSKDKTVTIQNLHGFADVPPQAAVKIFEGSLVTLVGERQFAVSSWSGRISCQLQIKFESATVLSVPIRVLFKRSSPPL